MSESDLPSRRNDAEQLEQTGQEQKDPNSELVKQETAGSSDGMEQKMNIKEEPASEEEDAQKISIKLESDAAPPTEKEGVKKIPMKSERDAVSVTATEDNSDEDDSWQPGAFWWDGEEPERISFADHTHAEEEIVQENTQEELRALLSRAFAAQDASTALRLFEEASQEGHPVAQCRVGIAYYLGKGVEQNQAEGIRWFGKAAVQGYALAQYYLGTCYRLGKGVSRNSDEAMVWHARAGMQGHVQACVEMAQLLRASGSEDEATEWWRRAAEQGDVRAQTQYGAALERQGNGSLAAAWYLKASRRHHPEAQLRLALCHYYGRGVSVNLGEALRYTKNTHSYLRSYVPKRAQEADWHGAR